MSITANLGDVKTTITHPSSTTHSRITAAERERAGITEGLLRISVGLEHLDDLKADLVRGLAAVRAGRCAQSASTWTTRSGTCGR
jgi:O-succinylhomoserine sulfhydrylase